MTGYGALAEVYEWLISDAKLTPAAFAAAFDDLVTPLPSNARFLDCSCGTGQLAVGLAGLGLEVVATDASAAMVRRTGELADELGALCGRLELTGMSYPTTSTTPLSTWCFASATHCTMQRAREAD